MSGPLAAGLVLGTVQWGLAYGIANRTGLPAEAEIERLLALAQAAGVTTLDTARAYGASEERIGRLVGAAPQWTVVTKIDPQADSADAVRHSLQASRRALRRETLDVVLLHRAAQLTAHGGSLWDVLRREREDGRIGRLGLSAGGPDDAWRALESDEVQCLQVASSLLDRRLWQRGFFEAALRAGRAVFVRSVYLQGVAHLQPDELPAHLHALHAPLAAIRAWATHREVASARAFLAFAAGLVGVRVLIGCETAEQLDENLRAWREADALAGAAQLLASELGELPADALDPALWPRK